jgi:D-alanyl-D-alanine carboxypeptidase
MMDRGQPFKRRAFATKSGGFVLIGFFALAAAWGQQTQVSNTPAGRALSAWLDAFNSADRQRIVEYQKQYHAPNPPPEVLLSFRTQTGGFDVLSITKNEPLHIEFLVKERGSALRASGTLDVSSSEPPQVRGPLLTVLPPDASHLLEGNELEAARTGAPYQRFSAWLSNFNAGDRARMDEFLKSYWPSRNLDEEMAFRQRTGPLRLRALQEATPTRLSGFVEAVDSDDVAWFSLVLEPHGARHITTLSVRLVPRPPEMQVARMNEAETLAALRSRLDQDSAADRFAGAVLVTKKGQTLFSDAYGFADREKKVPNTIDTRFRIGSMNKMFTGTAVLQLVQAGKIDLTDTLGKYIPDYPNRELAAKVTIHDLLTHTGGTGDIFGPEFDAHRPELRTLNDYVALYGKRAPSFEPGSRWEYSNYGMLLLGVVIERASGESYYDYVAQKVFKAAGMTRTGSEPESEVVPDRSVGYMHRPGSGEWAPNTDTLPYRGTSAGGGYSTAGDLVRFAEALLDDKLLDAGHTQLLMTGKVSMPLGARYAYGFEDARKSDGTGWIGHAGGAPGMNADLRVFPSSGYVVVVLSNLDPPAAQRVSEFLTLRLEK